MSGNRYIAGLAVTRGGFGNEQSYWFSEFFFRQSIVAEKLTQIFPSQENSVVLFVGENHDEEK